MKKRKRRPHGAVKRRLGGSGAPAVPSKHQKGIEDAPDFTEYAVSADYTGKRGSRMVSIQLSIRGPRGASASDVQNAIAEKLDTGENPEGWRIRLHDWRGRRQAINQERDWERFTKVLRQADLDVRARR